MRKEGGQKVNKPSVSQPVPQFNQKKEAKVLSAPTGNLQSANLSINQRMAYHSANKSVRNEDLPREPFQKDDILLHWKKMAHKYRAEEQEPLFLVMTKRDLVQLDEVNYLFETDNTIQLGRMEAVMEDLLGYLRAELKNYDLKIRLEVSAQQADETKYLTGKDKFERFSKINTNLLDLKNRFNLDIEP